MIKRFKEYVHGGPDASDEVAPFWEPDAPQQDKYHYAFYEVELDCEVDLETGETRCWGVNGVALTDPVKV